MFFVRSYSQYYTLTRQQLDNNYTILDMIKRSHAATTEGQILVRDAIVYSGMSQAEIAAKAGLKTRSAVSNFTNGKPVGVKNFQKLCEVLGLGWRAIAGLEKPSQ